MRYILLTGATSGIGLSLIEQITEKHENPLHIILACRNVQKGDELKQKLIKKQSNIRVYIVKMDVGIVASVLEGVRRIKEICPRLDCIFLNAGIMPVSRLNWSYICKQILALEAVEMFRTGYRVFTANDPTTKEGLKSIFATNILGHFILVQETIPLLKNGKSQIIWTTSTNACSQAFHLDDIMCEKGLEPYGSSKYLINAMNIELNKQINEEQIYSHLVDPGTVVTNITSNILPPIFWYVVTPIMWLMRYLLPELTIHPQTACFSMLWLLEQDPSNLKPDAKYCSRATITNHVYVKEEHLDISELESKLLFDELKVVAAKYTTSVARNKYC